MIYFAVIPEMFRGDEFVMAESSVIFRGTKAGLKVIMDASADISRIKADLVKKIRDSRSFFEGTSVDLVFTGKSLAQGDVDQIMTLLSKEIEMGSVMFEDEKKIQLSEGVFDGIEEGMTKFFKGTIRSGQRIHYGGNVVVIGDVNPGGEVIAGGNIMVMGALRGLAHAGAIGNSQAMVCAFAFQPTQLRIAGLIAMPPEDEDTKPKYPEIALIKDDNLVIEPYLPLRAK